MDKFIKELQSQERSKIVEVMAFMAYNPSIGRVLESGGVKLFQAMALKKIELIKELKSIVDFDLIHTRWVS